MPVVFSAEWNTADQVAFAPSGVILPAPPQEALDTLCPPGLYYVGGDGQNARPGKRRFHFKLQVSQLPLALRQSPPVKWKLFVQ